MQEQVLIWYTWHVQNFHFKCHQIIYEIMILKSEDDQKLIIFPNNDFKYRAWARELNRLGYETTANNRSYPFIVFEVIKQILKGKKIKAFVFRYLNDRRSIIKTIFNTIADITVIFLCKIMQTKIIWIAHNVDKESLTYYKNISSFRRRLCKHFANKIMVTDPLLINYAIDAGFPEEKIDWISFGKPSKKKMDKKNQLLMQQILEFKKKLKKQSGKNNIIMGLCVSSVLPKFYHFLYAQDLVRNILSDDFCVGLILIGKVPDDKMFEGIKNQLKENERIFYIEENFPVNEEELASEFDFFYRSVNDLSVSYSVYTAAKLGKPILTNNIGFLPKMVEIYGLGAIIPPPENRANNWISGFIKSWKCDAAEQFLAKRSWEMGAKRLVAAIKDKH